jgi:hypothetical protein
VNEGKRIRIHTCGQVGLDGESGFKPFSKPLFGELEHLLGHLEPPVMSAEVPSHYIVHQILGQRASQELLKYQLKGIDWLYKQSDVEGRRLFANQG